MQEIYVLDAYGYTAEIVPKYGMNCISLRVPQQQADIFRTPEDIDVLGNEDAFLFGTPILFFPNRISGGSFSFEGREYRFPINEVELNNYCHGTIHKLPFQVLEYDKQHILGVYTATEAAPYMTFPHSFRFFMEYRLEADGLHQKVSVQNTSASNMPFALAFHTTFLLPQEHSIRVPAEQEIVRNMANYLPTGELLTEFKDKAALSDGTYHLNQKLVSRFFSLYDRKLCLYDHTKQLCISYHFDEKYGYCMFYSNGTDYVCLEPQTWLTNCPNLPLDRAECGFDFIASGAEKCWESVIAVTSIAEAEI